MKKFIGYVIVLSLFVLPATTLANETSASATVDINANLSSYSIEKLEALIVRIQKLITDLKDKQIQCNISEIDLSLGDGEDSASKEQVKNFQNFLKEKGYFTFTSTGYFGKITRASVIAFQKAVGLEQTGELNAATRAYIKTLKCQKNYFIKNEVKGSEVKKDEVKNTTLTVSSISLKNDGKYLVWSVNGYSKNGFKIVWSKNPNPTYPTRDGDQYIYLSEPSAVKTTLEAFNGGGTYYARVCEYLGGTCGVYSNEIQVSL